MAHKFSQINQINQLVRSQGFSQINQLDQLVRSQGFSQINQLDQLVRSQGFVKYNIVLFNLITLMVAIKQNDSQARKT